MNDNKKKITVVLEKDQYNALKKKVDDAKVNISDYIRQIAETDIETLTCDSELLNHVSQLHEAARDIAAALHKVLVKNKGDYDTVFAIRQCNDQLKTLNQRLAIIAGSLEKAGDG